MCFAMWWLMMILGWRGGLACPEGRAQGPCRLPHRWVRGRVRREVRGRVRAERVKAQNRNFLLEALPELYPLHSSLHIIQTLSRCPYLILFCSMLTAFWRKIAIFLIEELRKAQRTLETSTADSSLVQSMSAGESWWTFKWRRVRGDRTYGALPVLSSPLISPNIA